MYVKQHNKEAAYIRFSVTDLICVQISFFVSYCIRHGWSANPYTNQYYLIANAIICISLLVTAMTFGTYTDILKRGNLKEFITITKHTAYTCSATLAVLFAIKMIDRFSRISFFWMPVIYLILANIAHFFLKRYLSKHRDDRERSFLIVADGDKLDAVEKNVLCFYGRKIHICQKVRMENIQSGASTAEEVVYEWIDEALIVSDIINEKRNAYEAQLKAMGITIHDALAAPNIGGTASFVEEIAAYPTLTTAVAEATAVQAIFKRLADILGGLVGSIACIPILLVIGPMIYIKDPGPIIFKQTRIGKNGKKFTFLKIRSMYTDAEEKKRELLAQNKIQDGMMFKMDDDPRIIPGIGKFIRKSSLDEFPQFFNVLKGDMSLVGTRPPTEDEWEKYSAHHRLRLAVKPGITGMWQVSGRSNITDFEEVLRLDTDYIYNWTPYLDVKIILKTVVQLFKKDGAE